MNNKEKLIEELIYLGFKKSDKCLGKALCKNILSKRIFIRLTDVVDIWSPTRDGICFSPFPLKTSDATIECINKEIHGLVSAMIKNPLKLKK